MNIPEALLRELEQVPGFDRAAFLAAHAQPAVTSVRQHPYREYDAAGGAVPWCTSGHYLDQRPVFTLDPAFHAGAYYVQEASSMFLDYFFRQAFPERHNLRVLDLCAAPGGKSTLLASLLEESSLLVSNEVIRTRASVLEENMTRWGFMNTWVTSNDPAAFGRLEGYFDAVVVDAPCSGSGLFRKDERALDEWSEANVTLCSQRQQRILADVWPSLKGGGVLFYATCSYSPQEDEQILDWLADTYDAESIEAIVPETWGVTNTRSQSKRIAGYRFMPHLVKGEGFFIAAVRKKEDTVELRYPKFKTASDKKIGEQVKHLLNGDNYACIADPKEGFNAIRPEHEPDLQLLNKALYLRKTGLALGMPSAKEWIPAHELALSIDRNPAIPSIALDKEQALRFLKKEEFKTGETAKGWFLITYNGLALGWVKSLGNRFNNYLPKHWRIRMDISDADWA